ncbi:beta-propeller domain-containing protein [Paraglaciecola arctica]|uniref:beta-propeller domain-containing protein n=1 Tax=Paraglaciecola arctica TaxID=1128911 RepID=UPI001C07E1D3|nr:beta-propeller domain-containing protein [Paraglaciecola arctica]MBU3004679.1 beta-propeller domain-containing protein [Paraglaciecola arctica]
MYLSKFLPKKNNFGDLLNLAIIAMVVFVLAACSDDVKVIDETVIERPTEAPKLNTATSFEGPLVKAGQVPVSRFIKNGIYSAAFDYANGNRVEAPEYSVTQDSASAANGDFSTTNTQESGVDEADRIEYDGNILYLAAYPQWYDEEIYQSKVRILERQNDFSLNSVAELPLVDEAANIEGMYQHSDRLAVLSTNFRFYTMDYISFAPEPWLPSEQKLALDIYDTSVPSSPSTVSNIKIDGTMLSSRRIDDELYIVTSYTAYVEGLDATATTEEELLENYLTILDTPDAELMPKIYVNGDEGTPLNLPEDCVIPSQATEKDGYAKLITVSRINLSDPNDIQSSCISSVANMLYMSEANLYLGSTVDNQTVLHKVSLDTNLTYQATGKVEGIIGWNGAPNLRLSEQNEFLRIVTTDYSKDEPEHKLSVLNQQGNELSAVATLPNEASPEPIGKPGEDIFAVRFLGDRGYIVTFERIDPLYVIDLANPNNPQVLGALEIPGFSSYLHPLDNGYLLGVGQQVSVTDIPENGEVTIQPVSEEGMKISLFDVTDPSNPLEVNSIVKTSAYTPVEYDYRALSVLNTEGSYQFALPVESWNQGRDELTRIWAPTNSLLLLEVDTTATTPELIQRSVVSPKMSDSYSSGWDDRSVIHGDNVYYIHGNQVWQTTWAEDAAIFGPF